MLARRNCAVLHVQSSIRRERPRAFRRPFEDALLLGGRQRRVQRNEPLALPRSRAQLAVRQAPLVQFGDLHQACRGPGPGR